MNPHIVLNFHLAPQAASLGDAMATSTSFAADGGLPTPFTSGSADTGSASNNEASALPSPLDNQGADADIAGALGRLPTPFDAETTFDSDASEMSHLPAPGLAGQGSAGSEGGCSGCGGSGSGGASAAAAKSGLPSPHEHERDAIASNHGGSVPRPDGAN